MTAACSSTGVGAIRSHRMEGDTIQALVDLAQTLDGVVGCVVIGRC